ncbi:alpha/beta fold hydrolase [Sutcliffiella rhizosphaerae]|uniref:Aminoacrylate hydrolase RutD n=1 Tax=Sutcliffiella rhizosphaerae TaxID=2880967 RepID=A0ABN8AC67_9BACI|nr:alpha/beta hydrolase [Sutcliffiella rhizosphaerae]CAG9620245.1 Putative aminoacrylate hydrolase RutD [Sutcliffiella rhizosphaerae]
MTKEMVVQISDCKLFARFAGVEYEDKPTIIMEAGYGDHSKVWDSIIQDISIFSRVLVYDRAGLGRSDFSTAPRTSREMVKELHELLHKTGVKPPYLLVGHSFGGIIARLFATEYPDEVWGLILVDSTPEDYRERFLPLMSSEFQTAYSKQFIHECNYDEFMESLQQVKKSKKELSIPLIVLSAGKKAHYSKESQALWHEMQQEILEISTNGEFIIAKNSAHYIQHDEPEIVVDAIKRLISIY